VATLRYGARSINVRQGDMIEDGVRVSRVNSDGVQIDFHGSKMVLGIERYRPVATAGAMQ